MSKRSIIVIQDEEEWRQYLMEAFEDTVSCPDFVKSAQEALPAVRKKSFDVVFANPKLLNAPLVAALQMQRNSQQNFRCYSLGTEQEGSSTLLFDDRFGSIPETLDDFQRVVTKRLTFEKPIRLLVVDDEPEIRQVYRDFFDHRTEPQYIVETASNGKEAEVMIEKNFPDVLVLDIKMPVKDGRELYRDLKRAGRLPPTIVFFDIVSADDVLEIRRFGNPAFVEKGSRSSGMPEMASLIKKIAYFG